MEENNIDNVSNFLNHIVLMWGEHLKKSKKVIEEVCKELDIKKIYLEKMGVNK